MVPTTRNESGEEVFMTRDPYEETAGEDYGPEWWAMDREVCTCGHGYDDHAHDDNIDNPDPGEPCRLCECYTFRPIDNQ